MIELRHCFPVLFAEFLRRKADIDTRPLVLDEAGLDRARLYQQRLCRFLVQCSFGEVSPQTEARIRKASLAELKLWAIGLQPGRVRQGTCLPRR